MATKKEDQREKELRKKALQKKYTQRITIAKQGREAMANRDYVNAIKKYNAYLSILAELHDQTDIFALTPKMFDAKKDMTEMLLISHVYWDLARVNEMTPKLQKSFQMALNQFIKFTINQPYQVLNAEMLRKYNKKNKMTSPQIGALEHAHQQIFVQSKKCFIATISFGSDHKITNELRLFKRYLTSRPQGIKFIDYYYRISSPLVSFLESHLLLKFLFKSLSRPSLYFLYILLRGQK